jgi:glycolate oxidase
VDNVTVLDLVYDKLVKIVGEEYVTREPTLLMPYSRDQDWPMVSPKMPGIVVRPITTEEIQQILVLASENKVPIIPLSRGLNVRGLCVPAKDNSIIVDLKRMNSILEINEDMMTATFQPGVTHGDLAFAVRKKGMRVCVPGAPATGSILANYLLRGVYHSTAGDGVDHALSAKIVLPNGKLVKLGASAFPNSTPHFRYTSGPDLLGMFSSLPGCLGICVEMTAKLYPLPEEEKWFMVGYDRIEDVIAPIPKLMLNDIPSVLWVLPSYTVVKLMARSPKEQENLRGTSPEYILPITIEGNKEIVDAKVKVAEKILASASKSSTKATVLPTPPAQFVKEFKYPRNVLGFLRGGSYHALAYWGPLNKYPQYIHRMKEIGVEAGYEAKQVDLLASPVKGFWGQGCYYEAEVPYSSADPESIKKVKGFHYATLKELLKMGIYGWFRPFYNPMKLVVNDLGEYGELWKSIMKLIDPNEIMNPGKVFPEQLEMT